MAFRNEEAALRARIDVLERELASLRDVAEERDRLKAQVEGLQKQLGYDEERKRRAAEERATARRHAREHRMQQLRTAVSALKPPQSAIVLGTVLFAAGSLWYGNRGACGPALDAAPTIGMVDLDVAPEPALPQMRTEGAASAPSGCRGYLPDAPQLVLRSSRPVLLRAAPRAISGDLVMVLVGPDGELRCDDDGGDSNNPLISAVLPPGDTRVWVGTYSQGATIDFTLDLTARPATAVPDETGLASTAPPAAGVLEGPDAAQSVAGTILPVVAASSIERSCRGHLPLEPQLAVRLTREAAVRLETTGSNDLVMLVRAADGRVLCDDDSGAGSNALVAAVLGPGEHRVWVGTFGANASSVPFGLDASAYAMEEDVHIATHVLRDESLVLEGTSSDRVGTAALGAPCGGGLVGTHPDFALRLDEPSDVVLGLATSGAPLVVVRHPDGAFECVTAAQSRQHWSRGDHRVYVGVPAGSRSGPYTLTARAVPASVQPWSPR